MGTGASGWRVRGHAFAWPARAVACCLFLLALTGASAASARAQGGTTYVVQPGDSLGLIAATYGTSVQSIMNANGFAGSDTIWVGQTLTIPIASPATPASVAGTGNTYTVQLGDTLNSIANALGVDPTALAQANKLTNPDQLWIGQPLLVPGHSLGTAAVAPLPAAAPQAGRYVVQPGDTLNGIAGQLGVTTAALLSANNLTNADLLIVGQALVVPGGAQPKPVSPATATPAPTDTPAASPAQVSGASTSYTVQPGDTLSSIARKLGVSAGDLMRANSLTNPDRLTSGQVLDVPGAAAPKGASAAAGSAPTPVPASQAPGPAAQPALPPEPEHYAVQPGDTLGVIARQFDTTAAAIARANKITSPDMLGIGTNLIIPAPDWTSPAIGPAPSRFVASISQQHCWLYQGNTVVASWTCSTGRPGADSLPGTYRVQSKMPKAFGSAWNIWMPYWLGIYYAGSTEDGIHGIPTKADTKQVLWDGLVGTPITFGCIMLNQEHAKQLYDIAYIGMPVIIQP